MRVIGNRLRRIPVFVDEAEAAPFADACAIKDKSTSSCPCPTVQFRKYAAGDRRPL
jgi:hypothetical protein